MKRTNLLALLLACLLLQGCASGSTAPLPSGWSEDWVRLGSLLGVEPMADFALNENKDALSVNGIYYATWTCGEARQFTNEDGENAKIYDAQIYVLVQSCRSDAAAVTQIGAWIARESQSYSVGEESALSCAGQQFDLLPLLSAKSENPYTHGMAAFAARGNDAICVEFLCADGYEGDPAAVLTTFLNGFHYND